MKSNEICEFELVVSKEMIECQMKFVIPYEMRSNQMKFVFLKVPKIISKQIASQHLKSLLSMTACDSLFSRDHYQVMSIYFSSILRLIITKSRKEAYKRGMLSITFQRVI